MAVQYRSGSAEITKEARRAAAIVDIDEQAAGIILESIRLNRHPSRTQALLWNGRAINSVRSREDLRVRDKGNDKPIYTSDIDDVIYERNRFWEDVSTRFAAFYRCFSH